MHLKRRSAGFRGWDYVWLFLLWASWLMLKLVLQIPNAPWTHLKETERSCRPTLWQRSIILKPFPSAFTCVDSTLPVFHYFFLLAHPLLRYLTLLIHIQWIGHLEMKHIPSAPLCVCECALICVWRENPGVRALVHVLILDTCVQSVFVYLYICVCFLVRGFGEISKTLSSMEQLFGFHQFKWNNCVL